METPLIGDMQRLVAESSPRSDATVDRACARFTRRNHVESYLLSGFFMLGAVGLAGLIAHANTVDSPAMAPSMFCLFAAPAVILNRIYARSLRRVRQIVRDGRAFPGHGKATTRNYAFTWSEPESGNRSGWGLYDGADLRKDEEVVIVWSDKQPRFAVSLFSDGRAKPFLIEKKSDSA